MREVKEETGFDCEITNFIDGICYFVNEVPKVVLFWKMSVKGEAVFVPNYEVDEIEWVSPAEAINRIKHKEELELIRRTYSL